MRRPLDEYRIPAGAGFGAVRAGGRRTHEGCDYHPLDNNDGEPIYGTGPGGVVVAKGYDAGGYGNWIKVRYPGGRETRDAHMREASPLAVGAPVDERTVLGHVGHTGNAAFADPPGSHDHHEVRINGVLVDPEAFYGTALAGSSGTRITEEDMASLKRIIFDVGDSSAPGFASTAIYNETTGFVKTSDGYGDRGTLEAYTAIGGVLGFNVSEVHVNADGWTLAQLFSDTDTTAQLDLAAIAAQLATKIGKDLASVTAADLIARLSN